MRAKHQKASTGHKASERCGAGKEETKPQGKEQEEKDGDGKDMQKYEETGYKGPKPRVFTHLSFIPKLHVQALASEGKFTEIEENDCVQTQPHSTKPYSLCQ